MSSSYSVTDLQYTVSEKHWGVFYGGLVALKYLFPLNVFLFFTHYPVKLFQILKECLIHSNDDVSGASANVLHTLSIGVKRNLNSIMSDPSKTVKLTEFREKLIELISVYLISVIENLRISINSMNALSCRCYSLCNGFSSSCLLLLHCLPTLSQSLSSSSSSTFTPSSSSSSILISTQSPLLNKDNNIYNDQNFQEDNNKIDSNVKNKSDTKTNTTTNLNTSISVKKISTLMSSEIILDVTVVLTSALSDILLKLMLFCRRSQVRCLLALKPGNKSDFISRFFFFFFLVLFYVFVSMFHFMFCFVFCFLFCFILCFLFMTLNCVN